MAQLVKERFERQKTINVKRITASVFSQRRNKHILQHSESVANKKIHSENHVRNKTAEVTVLY